MEWKDLYPELVNKIRWAIVSSLRNQGSSISYTEGQHLATVLSQDVLEIAKVYHTSPGVLSSTGTVRGFYQQTAVAIKLDGN